MKARASPERLPAGELAKAISGPPLVSSDRLGWRNGLFRRWRNVDPAIDQPGLCDTYLAMHLGGAKRIRRHGEGKTEIADIPEGAISIVPAGSAYRWCTEGPIDFAHNYLAAARVERAVFDLFGRTAAAFAFDEIFGVLDPEVRGLFHEILDAAEKPWLPTNIYIDCLQEALIGLVVSRYSNVRGLPAPRRDALSPKSLSRVLSYIDAHYSDDVSVGRLAAVAGASAYHFIRAFRRSMGLPPYAFLTRVRIDKARSMLAESELPVADVARACGFRAPSHFAVAFKKRTGLSPSGFRRGR